MPKRQVVHSQMASKVPSLSPSGGIMDHNPNPPFTKPHDVGGGGIPVKFQETLGAKEATRIGPATGNPAISAPSAQGPVRPIARAKVPKNTK